jgi:hypothetical protein
MPTIARHFGEHTTGEPTAWGRLRARLSTGDTRRMRVFDKTFLGSYDFAPEELLFQIGRMFTYPGAAELKTPWWIEDWEHERDDALVIGVEPADGLAWIGLFWAQIPSPRGASGVVALPDRESFAVLCAGAVYRVLAASPHDWEEISAGGVEAPVVVEDHEFVLFTEHTKITAYGSNGLAWRSARLVWDDLHAVRVEGSTLIAEGFDPASGRIVRFAVDLKTGKSDDAPNPDEP